MNPLLANIVLDVFFRGGPMMWPIVICLVAALVVGVERSLWWLSLKRSLDSKTLDQTFEAISEGRFDEGLELTRDDEDPFLAVIHEGLIPAHTPLLGGVT